MSPENRRVVCLASGAVGWLSTTQSGGSHRAHLWATRIDGPQAASVPPTPLQGNPPPPTASSPTGRHSIFTGIGSPTPQPTLGDARAGPQVLQGKRQQFGLEDAETRETELDVVEVSNRIAQELARPGPLLRVAQGSGSGPPGEGGPCPAGSRRHQLRGSRHIPGIRNPRIWMYKFLPFTMRKSVVLPMPFFRQGQGNILFPNKPEFTGREIEIECPEF